MAQTVPDLRKAAILVASVDRDTARTLLAKLLPEQIEQLEFAISRLGPIDDAEREAVLSEFAQVAPSVPPNRSRAATTRPTARPRRTTGSRHHDGAGMGHDNVVADHAVRGAESNAAGPNPADHQTHGGRMDTAEVELSLSAAAEAGQHPRFDSSPRPPEASAAHAADPAAPVSAANARAAARQVRPSDSSTENARPAASSIQQTSAGTPAASQPSGPSERSASSPVTEEQAGQSASPDTLSPPTSDQQAAFSFLQHADQAELVALLANEHPQTTTVVLSHMPPERAARVLAELPDSQQADIVRRLVHLEETHPDVLRELEAGLARHLRRGPGGRPAAGSRGTRAVVEMLRAGGRRIQRRIVDNVRRHDAELAQRITPPKTQLRFHDLLRFEPTDRAAWAREADADLLALALLGCSAAEAESLLAVLPATMADTVRQKIAQPGPVRLEDIDLAQQTLTRRVQRAIDEGRLEPNTNESHVNMAG